MDGLNTILLLANLALTAATFDQINNVVKAYARPIYEYLDIIKRHLEKENEKPTTVKEVKEADEEQKLVV